MNVSEILKETDCLLDSNSFIESVIALHRRINYLCKYSGINVLIWWRCLYCCCCCFFVFFKIIFVCLLLLWGFLSVSVSLFTRVITSSFSVTPDIRKFIERLLIEFTEELCTFSGTYLPIFTLLFVFMVYF